MIKVSVVVPVYNVEKYLSKCLNSLAHQTLEDIEIIIVNDGSTDSSQEIIEDFQYRFPLKIKNFTKENGGLSDARNYGLDRAAGEYIGFVDSDDEVSVEMFAEMYSLGKKHSAEIVICNLEKVDEHGKVLQKLTQIPNLPEKINLKENFSLFSDISYFACNKIFKKELFQELRFKKGVHFEDIQLIPQLVLKSHTIAQTQKYYYQYLERKNSISKTHSLKGLDILKAVDDVGIAFLASEYYTEKNALKNFQILEGVYSFLAFLAFVKDEKEYEQMSKALLDFRKKNNITVSEIFLYKRFGTNYLLSLTWKKKIYYLLYFLGQEKLLRKLI